MTDIVIGIDLGGTRIKGVAIDESGNILHQHYHPTYDGDDRAWMNSVASTVQEIRRRIQEESTLIGISAPGLPNESNSA
ncbi:MAG TPA: ROK family protein, partial [Bacteroidales bacterium]|nr:ROK family protein [Bacteroidales bacterium]